ncbi:MAG: type II secretion system GspH family protein [Heliobacteriaceae bacterium]|jgi:prepilin-type N-terminal cleavage/methylation domain-containing protein|nr:type II secretion system GspH family protein [Heliobacteriaceae bacterium]
MKKKSHSEAKNLVAHRMTKGFTLAELLITLGIIGVVAALTMPSLIHKQRNKVLEAKFKRAYNVLFNATFVLVNEEPFDSWQGKGLNQIEPDIMINIGVITLIAMILVKKTK